MNAEISISWTEQNQAALVREFAALEQRLQNSECDVASDPGTESMDPPSAIDRICALFRLSRFERELLLLCAGVEMNSNLAACCGKALGHSHRGGVTFGLALSLLEEPHWTALTPVRPLRRFRLLEMEAGYGLTSAPLRIDERVLHYLAGLNLLDPRLQALIQENPYPDWIAPAHQAAAAQIGQFFEAKGEQPPIVHLCGDDPQGQEDTAAVAAREIGLQLFTARVDDLPPVGSELDLFSVLWQREALLVGGALMIQCAKTGLSASACHLAERLPGVVFLASREPFRLTRPCIRFELDRPEPTEQKRLWERELGPAGAKLNGTVDAVSEQFRLSAKTIHATSASLISGDGPVDPDDLWEACRSHGRPRLEAMTQRIVPSAGWDELVLPELQKRTLRQLASQVRHRMTVHETWGFSAKGRRGLGVSALFTGESGTGKTLAAEVLAHELALDLYRIDLSSVVSKYIGETEKNLKQVFDAAEEGGVLLLFDEADALFGKRGEVKDSRDRYANIEVSYLLQRMEAYQGLAILTTNLKSAMDKAFQRRLRFTVNFPFPDARQREAIWARAFPSMTPTLDLDARKLAQLNVTGGNIRNIALNAAFFAVECQKPVDMKHLLQAARLEAQKIERPVAEAEIRGWV